MAFDSVRSIAGIGSLLLLGWSQVAPAETRVFTYNERGELVATSVSGGPNSGTSITASFDQAGNRQYFNVTGSPIVQNGAQPKAEKTEQAAAKAPDSGTSAQQ